MDTQRDEQDIEFEAFLRQFRLRTPPAFRAVRLRRRVTPRTLGIAAAVLLACAIPLQFLWNHSASDDRTTAASRETLSSSGSFRQFRLRADAVRQEQPVVGRALSLIPSIETRLSAFPAEHSPGER